MIEATYLHTKNIWYNEKNKLWQTYLPTNKGRFLNGKYEGTRIYDRYEEELNKRINYFYKTGKVLPMRKYDSEKIECTRDDYLRLINIAPCCVYEYVNKNNGNVQYVGIVYSQTLLQRHKQHTYNDEWCNNEDFYIRYFETETRSEAEALESHFIALHKTYKHFNEAKSTWGVNSLLRDFRPRWLYFNPDQCEKTILEEKERSKRIKQERKKNLKSKESIIVKNTEKTKEKDIKESKHHMRKK